MDRQSNIAIIVPVMRDAASFRALADRIDSWADQPREIIVVSGETNPDLRSFCDDINARYLETEPCRGKQLDTGARASEANVLWFLHADAVPYPSSLGEIALAMAEGAEGGHFRFRFTGPRRWRKEFIEWLVGARIRCGGIPYGDQGLFARRQAYLDCGGFPHQPLFEEVELVKRLRARRRFRSLATPIGVSPRRWERDGWIRRSLSNRRLAIRYALGAKAEQLASAYDPTSHADEDASG